MILGKPSTTEDAFRFGSDFCRGGGDGAAAAGGLSDREAVAPRLRRSEWPNRIFETALEVVRKASLIGRKRVLNSTALYDAVATQDTVMLMRSAIRALLRIADEKLDAIRQHPPRHEPVSGLALRPHSRTGAPSCESIASIMVVETGTASCG